MASRHEVIECKTIDGITIRGWFYEVGGPSPVVILSHGFNCVKEMSLPDIAERFQDNGYNALLYDARGVGASDGMPRNESDPLQMAADLSDLITHVGLMPSVDAQNILLWGMSFGAMVSGICAAVDRRTKGVIMLCPLFSFIQPSKRENLFAHLIRDRISQLHGNPAITLLPFNDRGDNPAGMGGAGGPGGLEAYNLMRAARETGHPGFRDKITLQTYYKLALARPKEIMIDLLRYTPVMMIVPELDDISNPNEQKELFNSLNAPKRLYWAEGAGHLSILTGNGALEILEAIDHFCEDALGRRVE
ncbi:Alpha/Beta hydrolase protein [Nemania abortiva]|nr:Alpha/Beta hydrolase protein [Nemania abortiva]